MPSHLIAIDQGTTWTRASCSMRALKPVASAIEEFAQNYRRRARSNTIRRRSGRRWSRRGAGDGEGELEAKDVAGIGITNQRETTLLWDRATGSRSATPSSGRTGARRKSASS